MTGTHRRPSLARRLLDAYIARLDRAIARRVS